MDRGAHVARQGAGMGWRAVKAAAGVFFMISLYASQALTAPPEDLSTEARRAAALLTNHQQTPGYWLNRSHSQPALREPAL